MKKKLMLAVLAVSPLATLTITSGLAGGVQKYDANGTSIKIIKSDGTEETVSNIHQDTPAGKINGEIQKNFMSSSSQNFTRLASDTTRNPNDLETATDKFVKIEKVEGDLDSLTQKWRVSFNNNFENTGNWWNGSYSVNLFLSDDYKIKSQIVNGQEVQKIRLLGSYAENSPAWQTNKFNFYNQEITLSSGTTRTLEARDANNKLISTISKFRYESEPKNTELNSIISNKTSKKLTKDFLTNQDGGAINSQMNGAEYDPIWESAGSFLTFTFNESGSEYREAQTKFTIEFETERNLKSPSIVKLNNPGETDPIEFSDKFLLNRGRSFISAGIAIRPYEGYGFEDQVQATRYYDRNALLPEGQKNDPNAEQAIYKFIIRETVKKPLGYVDDNRDVVPKPNFVFTSKTGGTQNGLPISLNDSEYKIQNTRDENSDFSRNRNDETTYTKAYNFAFRYVYSLLSDKIVITPEFTDSDKQTYEKIWNISGNDNYYYDDATKTFFFDVTYEMKNADKFNQFNYWVKGGQFENDPSREYKSNYVDYGTDYLYGSKQLDLDPSKSSNFASEVGTRGDENVNNYNTPYLDSTKAVFRSFLEQIKNIYEGVKDNFNYLESESEKRNRSIVMKILFDEAIRDQNIGFLGNYVKPNNLYKVFESENKYSKILNELKSQAYLFNKDYSDFISLIKRNDYTYAELKNLLDGVRSRSSNFSNILVNPSYFSLGSIYSANSRQLDNGNSIYSGVTSNSTFSKDNLKQLISAKDTNETAYTQKDVSMGAFSLKEILGVLNRSNWLNNNPDSLGGMSTPNDQLYAELTSDPEFVRIYNETVNKLYKNVYDFLWGENNSNTANGLTNQQNIPDFTSISYTANNNKASTDGTTYDNKQYGSTPDFVTISENGSFNENKTVWTSSLNSKAFGDQFVEVYKKLKAQKDLEDQTSPNTTKSVSEVMKREWEFMIQKLESLELVAKINDLPYISQELKNQYIAAIQNPDNDALKGNIYEAAKNLSGLGTLNDEDPANNGAAKSILKHVIPFEKYVFKGYDSEHYVSTTDALDLKVRLGASDPTVKAEFKDIWEKVHALLKVEPTDNYSNSNGYSDKKVLFTLGNTTSTLSAQELIDKTNEIKQKLEELTEPLENAIDNTNGATLSIDLRDDLGLVKSEIKASSLVSEDESEKAENLAKLKGVLTKQIEASTINGKPNPGGWTEYQDQIVSIIEIVEANDSAGTLKVKYVVNTDNINQDYVWEHEVNGETVNTPIEGIEYTITGFKKINLEEIINDLVAQVDYAPKDWLLAKSGQELEESKLSFTVTLPAKSEEGDQPAREEQTYTVTAKNNEQGEFEYWWIEDLKVKLVEVEQTPLSKTNERDKEGKTQVNYAFASVEEPTIKSNVKQAELTGFQTEVSRLDSIQTSLSENVLFADTKSSIQASSLTKEQVIAELKTKYETQLDEAHIKEEDLQITSNDSTGELTVTFKIQSDRQLLTDQTASDTKTLRISGFQTEQQRIDALKESLVINDYSDKTIQASQVVYDQADGETPTLSLTLDGEVAKFKDGVYVFEQHQVKIAPDKIKTNYYNDIEGKLKVEVTELMSMKDESAKTTDYSQKGDISGFLTEAQRLDALKDSYSYSLTNEDSKQKLPSAVTETEFTLNGDNQSTNKATVENADGKNSKLTPNDSTGTVNVDFRLKTTKTNADLIKYSVDSEDTRQDSEKTSVGDVYSSSKSQTFTGFRTDTDRAKDEIENFDPANIDVNWKDDASVAQNETQAGSEDAKNIENYTIAPNAQNNNYEVIDKQVVGHDEITGRTLVRFRLKNTSVNGDNGQPIESTRYYYKAVSGFQTEQQRVDALAQTLTNDGVVEYRNENVDKNTVFATTLEKNQISNAVIENADNKVKYTEENGVNILSKDDILGQAKVNITLNTAKTEQELFNIDSSVSEEDKQKLNTQDSAIFATPTEEQFAVKANKDVVISGFKTKLMEIKEVLEQTKFLNAKEVQVIDVDGQSRVGSYNRNTEFDQAVHDRAVSDMDALIDKANKWEADKKAKYDEVATLEHLNESQKEAAKKAVIDSYIDYEEIGDGSLTEEDSTDSKVQKATTLNEDMSALKQRVDKTTEESDYNKAKNGIIEQYSSDITAAKAKEQDQRSDREKALVKLGEDIDKYNKLVDLSNDLINNIDPSTQDLDRNQKDADKVTLLEEVLEGVDLTENANWPSESVNKLRDAIDANLKQVYKDAIDAFENLNETEKTSLKSQIDQINNSVDENQESKNLVEEANKVLDRAKEIEKIKQDAIDKILDAKYLSKEPVEDKDDVQDFVDKIKELDFSDPEQDEANKTKAAEIVKDAKKADLDQGIQNYIDNRLNDENPNKVPEANPDHTQSAQKQSAKQNVSELEGELPRQDDSQEVNSDFQDQKDAIEALKVINNLKDKYNSYINTDVNNESDYLTKRQELLEEIKKTEQLVETLNNKMFNDPKLEANKKAILDELKQEVIRAKTEVDLVDNVLNIKKPSFTKENFENAFKTDKNALNEQGIDKNNEVIDYIGTDMSMFYDLAKKKVNLSEVNASDLERVNVIKAAKYYQSPVLKSAIESLLPDKASKPYKDIEQLFRDVWALEFLSKEEKYAINLDLLEFKNYHDSDKYKAKAILLDAAKGDIYRQIEEMQNLNPSHKEGFKLAIIDTNLLKMDPLTKDVEVYESIIEEAKKLDDKMSELVKAAKQAQGLQGSDALDRINELVNSKEVDLLNNNVDAKEIDALIEELKEDIKKALQTIPNISQNFIDKLMEEYENGASLAQVAKKAVQTSQNRQRVNELVQEYLNNQDQEIRSEIDEITNQDPESYVDVTNLFAALDAKLELEKALDKFTSANKEQEDYDSIKQDLKVAYANHYLDSDYAKPIKDQIDDLRAKVRDILEKEEAGEQEIKPKDSNESGKPEEKLYIWWWIAGAIVTLGIAGLFAWYFKKRK
ncbi:lipoprotein 17-related variable surface protein [Mycoplasma sp. Ms02]|uniref:lipoprotein 17-related variable surface protein n=1 Tax=Mycoplasma sp. Ms02 TaxID=353851 RepID=UPI001C8A05F1|nr:lipoprotein 17-related variable surface protein [Mycoplasma sp. Ms02]QZE12428.1 hypothetical protein K4L35_00335 [Mycoplasma sp. Ms02]